MKLLTEVIGSEGSEYHYYPVEENKIIIRPAKTGRGGAEVSAKFDKSCLVQYKTRTLGLFASQNLRQKLILIKGADSCVSFSYKDENKETIALVDMPYPDREVIRRYFEASVIKNAGNVSAKVESPFALYILIIILIVISVVTLLVAGGVIHFR